MQFAAKSLFSHNEAQITELNFYVVSFASYACNAPKTHLGCPKYESDASIVRYIIAYYTRFVYCRELYSGTVGLPCHWVCGDDS